MNNEPDPEPQAAQADPAGRSSLARRVSIRAVLVIGDAKADDALIQAGLYDAVALPLVPDDLSGIPAVLTIAPGPTGD